MNNVYMVPNAVRHAGMKVTKIASRIHTMSSEDEVHASNNQLTGANLDAAVERAANALVKARTTFSKHLGSHSEALIHTTNATESQDQDSGRSFFGPQSNSDARSA